ncbi:MAG: acetate/propionate family kinase, partial [Thermoplasmata archaeon]|nr:acetate/propionate family kinase [Thermoplasmata archaeon]
HRGMPRVAQMYGLPRSVWNEGVRRFGFHGLSYESILNTLARGAAGGASHRRLIIAHLGNGASLCAVKDGKSVDTTMGFTPTGGLVMGTRSGDLDPQVVVWLLTHPKRNATEIRALLNQKSGLLGVSGLTSDMQALLARAASDPAAQEAIDLFCYQAQKHLCSLTTALGGLDMIVFTGGVGENSPLIRQRICDGLTHLGVRLDARRNLRGPGAISRRGSPVAVVIVPSDEEGVIARHTFRIWRASQAAR